MNTLSYRDAPPARRMLTIAVLLAAMAGTVLLCVGQGDFTMAVVVACAACLSFYLTEWKGVLRLSPLLANLAALGAVALVAFDFFQEDRAMQLIAIANLLVYLQIILFFQQKTVRVYWHLLLLALLQVVVGAALSLSATFGVVLLAFFAIAAFTLHVFFLADEHGQIQEASTTSSRAAESAAGSPSGRRWAYAHRPMEFAAALPPSQVNVRRGWRRAIQSTLTALAVALPIAGLVFFAVPRLGTDPWRGGPAEQQRTVGFSQTVNLGELGSIAENTEVVMRVKFTDPKTGRGIQLDNTPMLRGSVLTRYEKGSWSHHGSSYESNKEQLNTTPPGANYITQEISLEPLNEPVVFSVYPAYRRPASANRRNERERQPVVFDEDREQLVRQPERLQQSQLNVLIDTTGIVDGRQVEITPAERRINPRTDFRLTLMPSAQDRQRSLRTLVDVADRALQDAGAADADVYTICKTLERYLQRDGGFTYSLTTPARTAGLDPVEDFVANSRTGNCEYFASALALMLRSRGIPSRVVIGYQGGEWNSVGQFYQFRQLHTHSWVEVYLAEEELASYVPNVQNYRRRGGWLRLDPTAVTLAPQQAEDTGVLSSLRQATELAELVWIKYVVGMTSRRQQESLYRPIREAFRSLLDPVTFVTSLEASLHRWATTIWGGLRGNWFSWRGGVAAMFVCIAMAGVYWLVRMVARTVRRLRTNLERDRRADGQVVPFYERLEQVFASIGIQRSAEQTQREFATSVSGHLAESPATQPHAALPRRVADMFYGVRFGKQALSAEHEQKLVAGLVALEGILRETQSIGKSS